MKYDRDEVKAGIFVLVCVVILLAAIFKVGKWRETMQPKKEITVRFRHARGIKPDSPVYYAGVRAGRVADVRVDEQGIAYLTLQLEKRINIRRTSEIKIAASIMGESYVDITPGEGDVIQEGEIVEGIDASIAQRIESVVNNMSELIKSEKITSSLDSLEKTLKNVASVSETISGDRDKIAAIISNISISTEHIKGITESLDNSIEEMRSKITLVLSNIADMTDKEQVQKVKEITANILQVTDNTQKILEENRKSIREITRNIDSITDNLYIMSADLKRHPWKLIRKSREEDVEKYALQDAIIRLREAARGLEILRRKDERISEEELEDIRTLVGNLQAIQKSTQEREEIEKSKQLGQRGRRTRRPVGR